MASLSSDAGQLRHESRHTANRDNPYVLEVSWREGSTSLCPGRHERNRCHHGAQHEWRTQWHSSRNQTMSSVWPVVSRLRSPDHLLVTKSGSLRITTSSARRRFPSRNRSIHFSILLWRVSRLFAALTMSTRYRWRLLESLAKKSGRWVSARRASAKSVGVSTSRGELAIERTT